MGKEDIFKKLERIHNLPTLPPIIERLGKAVRDPNSDAKRVGDIVEDDPAMMARVLKVVNSAFYGVAEPIHSVHRAIAQMGLVAVNNIAMSTSVFSTFGKKGQTDFSREDFWRHSISCGIACNVVHDKASKTSGRLSKDVLHLAGLIHDIGKIIFEQFFHEDFMKAIGVCEEKKVPLYQAEQEVMETDHTEIGAWLAEKWKISPVLTDAIKWHHDPTKADEEHRELTGICHVSNYICNMQKIGNSGDVASPAFLHSVWKELGLGIKDITTIVDQVAEDSKESEVLLSFLE